MPDYMQCYLLDGRILTYHQVAELLSPVRDGTVLTLLTYVAKYERSCYITYNKEGVVTTCRVYSVRIRSSKRICHWVNDRLLAAESIPGYLLEMFKRYPALCHTVEAMTKEIVDYNRRGKSHTVCIEGTLVKVRPVTINPK